MRPSRRTGNAHASHLLTALAVGAAGAWLLDPVQGQRRRAALRHWLTSRGRALARFAGKGGRDLRNRAIGTIAETRGRLAEGEVPDETLAQRVRSAIGHACSHPSAIEVEVQDGCVALRGPVLASEHRRLLRAASGVRGVRGIEDQLRIHESPGSEPALQGGAYRPARAHLQPRPGTALLGAAIALGAGVVGARRARSRLAFASHGGLASERSRRGGAWEREPARSSAGEHHTVREVMTTDVVACPPDASAASAARLMKERAIGDVLVCEGDHLEGIVTDRDLAVRVLADDQPRSDRPLREICSPAVATVRPDDAIERAVELMKERAVRRLPVCEADGRLVGVVSIGDLAIERDRRSALGQISAAPPSA